MNKFKVLINISGFFKKKIKNVPFGVLCITGKSPTYELYPSWPEDFYRGKKMYLNYTYFKSQLRSTVGV